jgi:predicted transcriptional regulator
MTREQLASRLRETPISIAEIARESEVAHSTIRAIRDGADPRISTAIGIWKALDKLEAVPS